MTARALGDLQASVQDKTAFSALQDYFVICREFLNYLDNTSPTRINSPTHSNYIFFQYGKEHRHRITRPLNIDLFIESPRSFVEAFKRFQAFLDDARRHKQAVSEGRANKNYLESKEINKVVYTIQQSIGCIGDSFESPNQSRRRIGQLFENFIRLIINEIGLACEPRTINIPIPGYPNYEMSYQLDLVISRSKAIITSETQLIHPSELVSSVKTTSKDRLDKIFLDKYLLTKLIGREIPIVAIFLHDVQRAAKGNSIFGINSTFKSNHFLGYTVALTRLDGVYYVDPRPEMSTNERLRQQIKDFQQFIVKDLWNLTAE